MNTDPKPDEETEKAPPPPDQPKDGDDTVEQKAPAPEGAPA